MRKTLTPPILWKFAMHLAGGHCAIHILGYGFSIVINTAPNDDGLPAPAKLAALAAGCPARKTPCNPPWTPSPNGAATAPPASDLL